MTQEDFKKLRHERLLDKADRMPKPWVIFISIGITIFVLLSLFTLAMNLKNGI
jgi:hypothetical protein